MGINEGSDIAEVVGPIEPRKLGTVMSVRLSTDEIDYLRWYANATGMTVSEVLRQQIRALPNCVLQLTG
jgi:hypothetical protein